MFLAQLLVPVAVVIGVAAALVSRFAARDRSVPPPPSPRPGLLALAAALVGAGVLGTVAIALYTGGYAGSLERAAWAGGGFLAGFAAAAAAAILALALDTDDGRPAAAGPLTGVSLVLGAAAGVYALAAGPAGEGPWAAASLVAPLAAGAGLAAVLGVLIPPPGPRQPGAGPAAAIAAAAVTAGPLAGGEAAALAREAAWTAFPFAVLAAAIAGSAVALIPGTVMAAAGRPWAGTAAAVLAAAVTILAAAGAAVVLLPGGWGWSAGAAAAGAVGGLALAGLSGLRPARPGTLAGAMLAWALAAAAALAAWFLARELVGQGFPPAAGGVYGLALAAATALGPITASASLAPLAPRQEELQAGGDDAGRWAPPWAEPQPDPRPAAGEPAPQPHPAAALAGAGVLAALALALALGAHARHELLRLAAADPVRYAEAVQGLGLIPPGGPGRYALANDARAHRERLEELRAAIASDADFGPADVRLLLGADAAARDAFVAARLEAGRLLTGETAAIAPARHPLPSLLPLPATAGTLLGVLLGFAALAAASSAFDRPGRAWALVAGALAVPAALLGAVPALRFLGPGEADALALLAAFALIAGPGAGLLAVRQPGAAAAGPAAAALAAGLVAGVLA